MGYKRATLISDDNSKAVLRIAVSDTGDVFLKVMLGSASSEVVHLAKGGSTNRQILDDFSDIVDVYNCDVPIGHKVKVDGISYVCTKAANGGCDGCDFEFTGRNCPDVYCCGDDRVDGFDVQFKECEL